jgi:hypothetical protein
MHVRQASCRFAAHLCTICRERHQKAEKESRVRGIDLARETAQWTWYCWRCTSEIVELNSRWVSWWGQITNAHGIEPACTFQSIPGITQARRILPTLKTTCLCVRRCGVGEFPLATVAEEITGGSTIFTTLANPTFLVDTGKISRVCSYCR